MTDYKLMYFDGRGLGELIRYIFIVADVPFEDFRWKESDWPIFRPQMPLGQAPVLEIKEFGQTHLITQSNTIARFLANRFGLDGKTDIEQAKANSIIDQLNDLYFYYAQAYYRTEDKESKEREVEKLTRTKLPAYYRSIENMIEGSSTVYCIGDKITYADLAIACTVDRDQLNEMIQLNDTFLEAYPNIKRVFENVNNQPKIAEWRKTRNSTWF